MNLFLDLNIETNPDAGGLFPGSLAGRTPPGGGVEKTRRQEERPGFGAG
jgi:hypothetical protein